MDGNDAQPREQVVSIDDASETSQLRYGKAVGSPLEEAAVSCEWIKTAFEQHRGSLLRYCCHMNNLATAEEIVQETFARLCRKDESIEPAHLKKRLFKVCRNQAIDTTKRNQRMATSSLAEQEVESLQPTPAEQLVVSDEVNEIMQRVATLPKRQQEVIRLRFQAGLSYSEIAEVIESNVSNVGAMLHEAIGNLKKMISRDSGEDRSET